MVLEKYKQKRNFKSTPEPAGDLDAGGRAREEAADGEGTILLRPEAPRQPSALRLPARAQRRAALVGGAEGAVARSEDQAARDDGRGSPDRVRDVRRGHSRRLRRRHRHAVGQGTWTPQVDDVDAALKKGDLKFTLDGYKLKGSWVLVRTSGRYPGGGGDRSWLLIKHKDEWAGEVDIAEFAPKSVKSEGDFEDILAADRRTSGSRTAPPRAARRARCSRRSSSAPPRLKAGRAIAEPAASVSKAEKRRASAANEDPAAKTRPVKNREETGCRDQAALEAFTDIRMTIMNKPITSCSAARAPGAEAEFGACAERHGIEEVNFTFDGHTERAPPRRPGPQPRGAAGGRRQPGVRVEADAPPLHRQPDDPKGPADAVVPGQPRPGDLRRRRDPRRRDRARRDRLGRRVREAVQQAAVRVRPGEGRLVPLDRRRLEDPCGVPTISHPHFTGTGTRSINANGKKAIEALFAKF